MTNNNMIFVANWKMNGNFSDISKAKILNKLIKQRKFKRNKVVYCPPYTLIKSVQKLKLFYLHPLLLVI